MLLNLNYDSEKVEIDCELLIISSFDHRLKTVKLLCSLPNFLLTSQYGNGIIFAFCKR